MNINIVDTEAGRFFSTDNVCTYTTRGIRYKFTRKKGSSEPKLFKYSLFWMGH